MCDDVAERRSRRAERGSESDGTGGKGKEETVSDGEMVRPWPGGCGYAALGDILLYSLLEVATLFVPSILIRGSLTISLRPYYCRLQQASRARKGPPFFPVYKAPSVPPVPISAAKSLDTR